MGRKVFGFGVGEPVGVFAIAVGFFLGSGVDAGGSVGLCLSASLLALSSIRVGDFFGM